MTRWFLHCTLGLGLLSTAILASLSGIVWWKIGGPGPLVQVTTLFVLSLLLALGFASWNLLCQSLFASRVEHCQHKLQALPLRCYLMGVLVLLAQLWVSLSFPVTVVLWLALDGLLLCFSMPALAVMTGQGLGIEGRWSGVAGSLPLCLTLAFPVLGWAFLVQLGVAALGSALL